MTFGVILWKILKNYKSRIVDSNKKQLYFFMEFALGSFAYSYNVIGGGFKLFQKVLLTTGIFILWIRI